MSDLSISRQKAAKIIFPSHPDPSPPPSLRDGELMRFLFFYFFFVPLLESRREEGEGGRPKPRTASAAAVLQITFRHSACAPVASLSVVWLSLSPGEIRKGKKRQTNVLSGRGAKLAVDDATPSLHIRLDLTTPSPRGMDRFCRKKCRFSMTHLFFPLAADGHHGAGRRGVLVPQGHGQELRGEARL